MKKITIFCAVLLLLAGCTASPGKESDAPSASPAAPTLRPTEAPAAETNAPAAPPEPSASPAPVVETPPAETPAMDWDGTLETLTLAHFPTQLSQSSEVALGDKPLYLLAELSGQDTWLYGLPEQGLILRVGDAWQYFDIYYMTPQALLPEIAYGDFDGDMSLELALMVHSGGEIGERVWSLYIIELDDEAWSAHWFNPDDYRAILESSVTAAYVPESNTVILTAGESILSLPLEQADPGEFQGLNLGAYAGYGVSGDSILARFYVDVLFQGQTHATAEITANVIYTGSVFGLTGVNLSA